MKVRFPLTPFYLEHYAEELKLRQAQYETEVSYRKSLESNIPKLSISKSKKLIEDSKLPNPFMENEK